MVKIKICGITKLKEIQSLNILKPDYVGFVFTKSKRQVNLLIALKLIENLNEDIKTVGVFKNNSLAEILNTLESIRLNVIQLHGNESINFIRELKKNIDTDIEIWKAISIYDLNKDSTNKLIKDNIVDIFLIDSSKPGSGITYPLNNIKTKLKEDPDFKFFLAGGIDSENVLKRIEEVKPYGADVSSGVEVSIHERYIIKSFYKMQKFITKVRSKI